MKRLKHKRDLLKGALSDLNKELKVLRLSRADLEQKRSAANNQLDLLQRQGLRLRNLITLTMKKETLLNKRIAATKEKIGTVDQKIDKVKSIKEELGDV